MAKKEKEKEYKEKEVESQNLEQEEKLFGSCLAWFLWGSSVSFFAILSMVLLVLLIISATLNIYLGYELSGFEISISRSSESEIPLPIPSDMVAGIPTNTPELTPTNTPPAPEPTESVLESQHATISAIATEVAEANTPAPAPTETPPAPPTNVPTAVAIDTSPPGASTSESGSANLSTPTTEASTDLSAEATPVAMAGGTQDFAPPTSANSYDLLPIEGERESRPGELHGDLNLKLRDPQPINVELSLVDIPGSGIDPDAPKLSSVFEPNFVNAYTIHNWDWGCDCKGALLQEEHLVLVGIKTTPGEPVFIPSKSQDIYGGKYYAMVLYAAEDTLTFVYARTGTVVEGYTVHYLGLHTDPNLVALYQESQGNELPALTLDTPVGIATDELIVAIRDNGKFLDARSRKDWWE